MKFIDVLASILLVLAGLTWGGVGVADFNPLMWIFVSTPHITHYFYTAFGVAAIWKIVRCFCGKC